MALCIFLLLYPIMHYANTIMHTWSKRQDAANAGTDVDIDCESSGDGSTEVNLVSSRNDNKIKNSKETSTKQGAKKVDNIDDDLRSQLGEISYKLSMVSSIVTEMIQKDDGSDTSTAVSSSGSTMPAYDVEYATGQHGTTKRSNTTNAPGKGTSQSQAKGLVDNCANDCGEAAQMMGKAATCDQGEQARWY